MARPLADLQPTRHGRDLTPLSYAALLWLIVQPWQLAMAICGLVMAGDAALYGGPWLTVPPYAARPWLTLQPYAAWPWLAEQLLWLAMANGAALCEWLGCLCSHIRRSCGWLCSHIRHGVLAVQP